MAEVVFYEKPGCINNTRQKTLLLRAGHTLIVRNLLQHEWMTHELRRFFGSRPVRQWFNPSAPALKNGVINPARIGEQQALSLMLADPLLIRRPLMQVKEEYMSGFDPNAVNRWIGLSTGTDEEQVQPDLESCPRM